MTRPSRLQVTVSTRSAGWVVSTKTTSCPLTGRTVGVDLVNFTSTSFKGRDLPTVNRRVWVSLGPFIHFGSRTKSVGSETVTSMMSPFLRLNLESSRLELLWFSITWPFTRQVIFSSWYRGCIVSTQIMSLGPTSPSGVWSSDIRLASRLPAIRMVICSRWTTSKW